MRSRTRSVLPLLLFGLFCASVAAQNGVSAPAYADGGEQALARGEFFTAVEEFQSALRVNPNYTRALAGLAESYYWLAEYDQAARYADQALRTGGAAPELFTLAGRIAIGQGRLEQASSYFSRALAREPNNVDARLGQAELALAQGQSSQAISALERSLLVNPEHRKTLLSLVLIYEQIGRHNVARDYLELARRVHRDSSEVHVVAAEFFARAGDHRSARIAAERALALSPQNQAALSLLAQTAIVEGDFVEAQEISEQLLSRNRNSVEAWYSRAVAQYKQGDVDGGLTSARTALAIDAGAELVRIWAEWVAVRELALDDPVRTELAAARRELALELESQFRFSQALRAFRRALQLAPLDLELRGEFASLQRRTGNDASYLQELEVLRENGEDDPSIGRAIEVFRNALSNSVAFEWDVDQFTIDRSRTRLGVYAPASQPIAGYPEATESMVAFIRRTLASEAGVEIVDSGLTEGFSQAYERARAANVDYFIHINTQSSNRVFAVEGILYVGRTGAPVGVAQAVRTGPGRVTGAVDILVSRVVRQLPLSARIAERRGNRVLIDRGERDGLSVEQELLVLDPSAVTRAPDGLGYSYGQEAQLGRVTIVAVDEFVAEGTVVFSGPTDLLSVGDLVIAETEDGNATDAPSLFPVLYERIRALR